jgi:hypothetical protein
MTPRERILAALERRPVRRVPVYLWVIPEVLDTFRSHTGEIRAVPETLVDFR